MAAALSRRERERSDAEAENDGRREERRKRCRGKSGRIDWIRVKVVTNSWHLEQYRPLTASPFAIVVAYVSLLAKEVGAVKDCIISFGSVVFGEKWANEAAVFALDTEGENRKSARKRLALDRRDMSDNCKDLKYIYVHGYKLRCPSETLSEVPKVSSLPLERKGARVLGKGAISGRDLDGAPRIRSSRTQTGGLSYLEGQADECEAEMKRGKRNAIASSIGLLFKPDRCRRRPRRASRNPIEHRHEADLRRRNLRPEEYKVPRAWLHRGGEGARPKPALGCAGVVVSRFKMEIAGLVLIQNRFREEKPRTFLGHRLVEEEALFAALDVHIYHPLLLRGQTSGLTGHVRRTNSRPTPPRIEIRGSEAVPLFAPSRDSEPRLG
ncbi:hypothetical protein KM043_002641 [Ampulex compressa]|nr:hypothetical protein KM043_002641 [Ampulex compressa]